MADPFPLQPALWAATATPATATPPLDGAARADVCIVGAGYTGLSTALHLAESGIDVVVLDAHEPGWGGSGRNGGQVIPGLKYDPEDFRAMFPADIAEPLIAFAGSTADSVFELIDRHRHGCAARAQGLDPGRAHRRPASSSSVAGRPSGRSAASQARAFSTATPPRRCSAPTSIWAGGSTRAAAASSRCRTPADSRARRSPPALASTAPAP